MPRNTINPLRRSTRPVLQIEPHTMPTAVAYR